MDPDALISDSNERRPWVYPAPGVEVADAIAGSLHGNVSVSAEDAVDFVVPGVGERALADLLGQPQPARVHTVERAHEALVLEVELLQQEVRRGA